MTAQLSAVSKIAKLSKVAEVSKLDKVSMIAKIEVKRLLRPEVAEVSDGLHG